jgi:arylsulfatase A-like enzyme
VKAKPLDGLDVGQVFEGKPSPRTEVVYDIEPFRAALRKGDWKLIWQVALPSKVELYNLAQDPEEKNDLAAANPGKVAELQQLITVQAQQAAPPLLLQSAMGASKKVLFGSVALPEDDAALNLDP